ncbi:autotransporter domain-containing protein [Roseibium sp.]|uniref:autotransporter family protein n=1 Tax=Roseibium sp. TaxID=1936156 RepID=UPI003BA8DF33
MSSFSRQLLLTTVSTGVLVLALNTPPARADEIVIDSPETTTQFVDGDDTIVITGDGSIATANNFESGVQSTGDRNTITNDGNIDTNGNYAFGILNTGANSTITNSGDIWTEGENAAGISNFGGNTATIANEGSITTNDENAFGILNTGDNSNITNSGTIRTYGYASVGIHNYGANNATITNSGDIRTEGQYADGIYNSGNSTTILNSGSVLTIYEDTFGISNAGEASLIVNSGDIVTQGEGAAGVYNSGQGTSITNSGSIRTIESYADGIANTANYAKITNSGDIRTEGSYSAGLYNFGYDATTRNEGNIHTGGFNSPGIVNTKQGTVINNGTIRTTGRNAHGIYNSRNQLVVITNSGDIRTSGDDAYGIWNYYGYDARITNSGDIRTTGNDAPGFYSYYSHGTEFTNSGVIISEKSHAIYIGNGSAGTTLNLNAPSFFGGAITFDSETTLNITTGASHSVLWQLPTTNVAGGEANVSGPVPWFYDSTTGQFATFDPTGLTASFNQMANTANMLGRLGRYSLRQAGRGGSAGASSALAYGDDGTQGYDSFDVLLATNSGPDAAYGLKAGSFWLTGFGGEANYDGDETTLDHSIDQIGAALGYAWHQSPDMHLGLMLGYMNGSITAQSTWAESQDITSNGVFAGVHGDRRFGRLILGLGLAGGWQTSDSSRFVNDNTALTGGLTLGESTADASYHSWFVTPEAALSADIALGQTGIVLTPSIRGRYALQQTGSYTETGAAANAIVDSHTFGVAEGDFELAISRSFQLVTLTGRAGYLLRSSTGDDDVPVTLLGITNSIGLGETDRSAAYLGAGLDLNLGPQASFTLDGQGYLSDDVDALEGMARFAIRF